MNDRPPTTLGFAILGLLHQAPMSGYDLRKVFAETALGNYSSSPGAIYPALARLEKKGLVDGEEDRTTSLRPRKLYRPSAEGREALRTWLSQTLTREDVSRGLHELMLRFAFFSVLESAEATRRFLTEMETELKAHIGELVEQKKIFPKEAPVHSRLALEAGIAQFRAFARWARKALEHFDAEGE